MMSNMYPKTKTINPLLCSCAHDCVYCYRNKMMRRFPAMWKRYHGMPRLDPEFNWQKALGGKPKTVFVCSMTDIGAENITDTMREIILLKCGAFPQHTYLIHTKAPGNLVACATALPSGSIVTMTLETDNDTSLISCAPDPLSRLFGLQRLKKRIEYLSSVPGLFNDWTVKPRIMIGVEPIMDFSERFINDIKQQQPDIVSIGADTGGNDLPEPSQEKLIEFVGQLREFVPDVRLKENIRRLWPDAEVT